MELLRTNIATDGKLVGNKQERLSLVEEDGGGILESAKLAESTKMGFNEKKSDSTTSNQAYSPPSAYQSEPNLQVTAQNGAGNSFLKKKNTYETSNTNTNTTNFSKRNSGQMPPSEVVNDDAMLKKQILKEHGEATRGLHIAVDIIKSNDTNCVLFAYLILKKAEQKLVAIRDEIASQSEFKDLMMCLNSELKEVSMELGKYNLNENIQNWKALVKATGEFHRNYRAFYTMVAFLAGEIPREDLSHVEMQMEVRSKIY